MKGRLRGRFPTCWSLQKAIASWIETTKKVGGFKTCFYLLVPFKLMVSKESDLNTHFLSRKCDVTIIQKIKVGSILEDPRPSFLFKNIFLFGLKKRTHFSWCLVVQRYREEKNWTALSVPVVHHIFYYWSSISGNSAEQ